MVTKFVTLGVARAATEERFGMTGEPMSREGDKPNNVLLTGGSEDVTGKVEPGTLEGSGDAAEETGTLEETTGVADWTVAEGREVYYLIEIKETNGEDPSELLSKKSANQIFDKVFEDLDKLSTRWCTIFKVNVRLRESNPDAYTPTMVSIGPYHRGNDQFRPMEKYKLFCLRRFLQRKKGLDVESCINELEKLKKEALECYEDIEYLDIDSHPEGDDKLISTVGCICNQILRDLLLLENQLSFFVLNKLHDMTKQVTESPFIYMVERTFLLAKLPKMNPTSSFQETGVKAYMGSTWPGIRSNATELSEAGVRFASVGNIFRSLDQDNDLGDTSLFDIKFKNGLMTIPCFQIVDDTEVLLRNLIAYENLSSGVHPKYLSDFAVFMDYFIDSEKDVSLLRMNGIIVKKIGDDKEVASFFNKISKGITVYSNF
ncbi:hypothetical protein BC332_12962 [Capsicum chinense]|nr:hypothetical protein BC332_12962 [Capsicum chinense]